MPATPPARFLTIAFSHYCDKARWAMDRVGFPYREEPHLPVFHYLAVLSAGARRTVPALLTEGQRICDSTDILHYLDRRHPDAALFPAGPLAAECAEWEDYFDLRLGPHTRRYLYFHLLADRALALRVLCAEESGPRWERRLCGTIFSGLRAGMRRGLGINEESARRSRQKVDEAFARVTERLRDGRRFLLGDRFTAADLTFAAMAAPLLQPPEYGFSLPPLSTLPAHLAALVEEARATPAGAFGMRLYAEERRRRVPTDALRC